MTEISPLRWSLEKLSLDGTNFLWLRVKTSSEGIERYVVNWTMVQSADDFRVTIFFLFSPELTNLGLGLTKSCWIFALIQETIFFDE